MNPTFYIQVSGQKRGPFTLDELRGNIEKDTLIWTEGSDKWTKAENIPLLESVFKTSEPQSFNEEQIKQNLLHPMPSDFKQAIHPREMSRFILALVTCIPILLIGIIMTYHFPLAVIPFVAIVAFLFWFILNIIKAHLIANSVQVSQINFPDVYKVCEEVKVSLEYSKEIKIFITGEGGFNAFLYKYLRTRFIILTSSLVEDMSKEENKLQLVWIVSRFIGALKTKLFKLEFLRILIESIDQIKIFSFLILPYERATQYTGDNIGMLVCGNIDQVIQAFDKFLVGNKLSHKVNLMGIIEQKKIIKNSFFAFLARLGSTHPHQIDRHLNLLAFAKKTFPQEFDHYITKYNKQLTNEILAVLPKYYGKLDSLC